MAVCRDMIITDRIYIVKKKKKSPHPFVTMHNFENAFLCKMSIVWGNSSEERLGKRLSEPLFDFSVAKIKI